MTDRTEPVRTGNSRAPTASTSLAGDAGLLQAAWTLAEDRDDARRRAERLAAELVELRAAADSREAMRRTRLSFLTAIARDARTTVNGNLGVLRLLAESRLDDAQADLLGTAIHSSQVLLSLLGDVLDYASLQFTDLAAESGPYDLHQLFADAVERDAPRAREQGLELSLDVDPDVPRWAVGPAGRVHQVLHQLISNAIQFTPTGGITVRLRLVSDYGAGFALRAEVQDTGIGIPRERQTRLFQEFSSVESAAAEGSAAVGLGLAVCQHILGLMDGLIGVDSMPGKGSTFWFTVHQALPGEDAVRELEALASPAPAAAAPDGTGAPHVLVAEDSPVNQKVARRMLERLGCTCEIAADGERALELFFERRFDLVLMDCVMPGLDGYEATRAIRARLPAGTTRVPIVALTANTSPEDRARATLAGMDGFITKPLHLEVLRQALEHFFARRLAVAA